MVILGAFIVATGNALPKTLTPLSVLRCDPAPARAQALHRFAGWAWVLTSPALSVAWLALPVGDRPERNAHSLAGLHPDDRLASGQVAVVEAD